MSRHCSQHQRYKSGCQDCQTLNRRVPQPMSKATCKRCKITFEYKKRGPCPPLLCPACREVPQTIECKTATCQECGAVFEYDKHSRCAPLRCDPCKARHKREASRRHYAKTVGHPVNSYQSKTCPGCGCPIPSSRQRCEPCAKTHAKAVKAQAAAEKWEAEKSKRQAQKPGGLAVSDNNACARCVFLQECRRIVDNSVRIGDVLISPYCFVDSPYYHRYQAKYAKSKAGNRAGAARGVSA